MKRDKKDKEKDSYDDFMTGAQPGIEVSEDDVTEGELVDLDHLADEPGEIVFGEEPLPA